MDKALVEKVAAAALALVPAAGRIVDVEAGLGALTMRAAREAEHVDAVDASKAMVAALKARIAVAKLGNVEARVGDAAALPFPEHSFDAAYYLSAASAASRVEALAELRRVLKPGAAAVVAIEDGTARNELVDEMMVAGFDEVEPIVVERTSAWLVRGLA
jgi:ubiquinone/menaquinone biosynthesis C-methylase UbiE